MPRAGMRCGWVRRLVVAAAAGAVLAACGGGDDGGGSPADRVTDPIDKARQTATSVEERDKELEDRAGDGY